MLRICWSDNKLYKVHGTCTKTALTLCSPNYYREFQNSVP